MKYLFSKEHLFQHFDIILAQPADVLWTEDFCVRHTILFPGFIFLTLKTTPTFPNSKRTVDTIIILFLSHGLKSPPCVVSGQTPSSLSSSPYISFLI